MDNEERRVLLYNIKFFQASTALFMAIKQVDGLFDTAGLSTSKIIIRWFFLVISLVILIWSLVVIFRDKLYKTDKHHSVGKSERTFRQIEIVNKHKAQDAEVIE